MRQKIQNQNPDFTIKPEDKLPYFFEKDGLEMKSSYTECDIKNKYLKSHKKGLIQGLFPSLEEVSK